MLAEGHAFGERLGKPNRIIGELRSQVCTVSLAGALRLEP